MMIRVVTDSVASLPQDLVEDLNIDVVSLFVHHEGKEYDDATMDLDDFYGHIYEMVDNIPTSSQPSQANLEELFEGYAQAGDEVLGIWISTELSGTYDGALRAARAVESRNIGFKYVMINSTSCGFDEGWVVVDGAEAVASESTLEEAAQTVLKSIASTRFLFTPENLTFLKKGGRIGGAAALIGAALALGWFARRQEHLARPLVSMGPLHHGMFWPAALLVMVTMMTYFSLSVMAPLYFEEAAGLAASAAGVLMVAPVLANAAASVLSGRALDRWGEWPLLPAGLAIAVAGLGITIAGALAGSVVVATVGIFFGYLGTGMVLSPAQTAGLRRLPDELDSHGVTLMSMAVQLSACLGPAAYIGIMSSATAAAAAAGVPAAQASAEGFAGAMIAALVVAAAGLVTAVFYARFTRRRRR